MIKKTDLQADMKAIASMISAAEQRHLLVEVIESFGEWKRLGWSTQESVQRALEQWDIV